MQPLRHPFLDAAHSRPDLRHPFRVEHEQAWRDRVGRLGASFARRRRRGDGGCSSPLLAQRPHGKKGIRAVGLLCSPNARPTGKRGVSAPRGTRSGEKWGLVQARSWRPISPHARKRERASLEGKEGFGPLVSCARPTPTPDLSLWLHCGRRALKRARLRPIGPPLRQQQASLEGAITGAQVFA